MQGSKKDGDVDGIAHERASPAAPPGWKVPTSRGVPGEGNSASAPDPFSELFSGSLGNDGNGCEEQFGDHSMSSMDPFKDRVLLFGEEMFFSDTPGSRPSSLTGTHSCTSQETVRWEQLHDSRSVGQYLDAFSRENRHNSLRFPQDHREEVHPPKSLENDVWLGQQKRQENGNPYTIVKGSSSRMPTGMQMVAKKPGDDDFGRFIDMFLSPSSGGPNDCSERQYSACRDVRGSPVCPEMSRPFRAIHPRWPGVHAVHAVRRDCYGVQPFHGCQPPLDIGRRGKKQSQNDLWNGIIACHPRRPTDHILSPGSRCGYPSLGRSPFASRISQTWNANGSNCMPFMGEWMPKEYGCERRARPSAPSSLLIRIKLFRLSRMSGNQKMQVWKLANEKGSLESRFYRTLSKMAEILGLPELDFTEYIQLKMLDTLFRQCGEVLDSSVEQLNCHKTLLSRYHHMYLSYILPLMNYDVFYRPRRARRKCSRVDRQGLVLCLTTGVCDDILFIFERLEKETVSADMASEILELFFQVSEALLRRLGYEAPSLQRLKPMFKDKQYRHAVEKMSVKLLGNIQEAAFRVLLRHKEAGRGSLVLSRSDVMMAVDALLARKSLPFSPTGPKDSLAAGDVSECKDAVGSFVFEPSVCDMIDTWALRFVFAAGVTIDGTDAMLDALECATKHSPEMALRASGMILMCSGRRRALFLMLRELIERRMYQHLQTMESKVLLKDNRELEIIVNSYLEYLLETSGSELLDRMVVAVRSYRKDLMVGKVYFRKKNSSNIETVAEVLELLLQSLCSRRWPMESIKCNL